MTAPLSPAANPVLETDRLTRTYGQGASAVHALRAVSFRVLPGQMVAVVGPSGSGKSTLLNLLAGLDRPSEGDVVVMGRRIHELAPDAVTTFRRRHVGFVFQFFNLLPTMTARRNVALPLLADRQAAAVVDERTDEALAAVGMLQRAGHKPTQLSGGEQQRIAIARALVMRPPLVLADEPTGNLDSVTGADILRLLRGTVAERGTAIVLVTHSDAAAAAADRVLEMRDGRLTADRHAGPVAGM